jgi:polyisoprenoid-binding protein YceI
MIRKTVLTLLFVSAALVGCKSEIDNKPAATVTDVKAPEGDKMAGDKMAGDKMGEEKPAADKMAGDKPADPMAGDKMAADKPADPMMAPAGAVKLDKAGSSIGFVGAKVTGDHKGDFKDFDGELTLKDGKPEMLKVTVQTASLLADDEKLTGHLKSPDFFDVEKFTTATFTSTSIVEKAEGGNTHEVTGNLEMHGLTKQVTFPASVSAENGTFKGTTEFTVKRFDWEIKYPGKPDDLIKDDVLLKVNLTFPGKI